MSEASLYRLMTWLSPAFPVGAFSHSQGLEWAVEAGWVGGRKTLTAWLTELLERGSGWNDAVLFVHAHRAAGDRDAARFAALAELARAAAPARERRLETLAQGEAFRRAATGSWPAGAAFIQAEAGALAYPLAVAAVAAGHGVPLQTALTAFLLAFAANLVSAAQRLVPLGQSDAQAVLAQLEAPVLAVAARAAALPADEPFEQLGGATPLADLAAILHETQYTRLFRT